MSPEETHRLGALVTRLRLHAYELTNGGANASQLRDDLRASADIVEVLVRAAPPAAEPAWQPIASAPKDGTRILVCWPNDAVAEAYYSQRDGKWNGNTRLDPKCWMPLPSPPAGEAPEPT